MSDAGSLRTDEPEPCGDCAGSVASLRKRPTTTARVARRIGHGFHHVDASASTPVVGQFENFWSSLSHAAAGHTLLCEPLDGAGNRGSGNRLQQAQVRDLRRTRPYARGFPSLACDAPLAWFADAACVPPHVGLESVQLLRRRALLRGATVSAVTCYRK